MGAKDAEQLCEILAAGEGRRLAGVDRLVGVETVVVDVEEAHDCADHENKGRRYQREPQVPCRAAKAGQTSLALARKLGDPHGSSR